MWASPGSKTPAQSILPIHSLSSAVFGWEVEVEPAGLDGFAVGVPVLAFGCWWRGPWGLGFGPCLGDRVAVLVCERHPINLVRVAADTEFAFVM